MDDNIPPRGDGGFIGDEDYKKGFSESLDDTLNPKSWKVDWETDIGQAITDLSKHISTADQQQGRVRATVRSQILPMLRKTSDVDGAGVFKTHPNKLRNTFDALLYPGRVAALSSTVASHESLALGITQIGMVAVSYGGRSETFVQRMFRKNLTTQNPDALKEVVASLKRMHHVSGQHDIMSELARRGIRAYADRAVLLENVDTEWRVGLGNPCSREILSGLKYPTLLARSLDMLRKLITVHKKFLFVATSLDERTYLTIGDALKPGEYAILHTIKQDSHYFLKQWEYNDQVRDVARKFVDECCPDVIIGLFRVSEHAPARLFYAHREFAHLAAHIAMADSLLSPARGFPMLLDVANDSCRSLFGSESFLSLVHDAYARAGAKFHYFGER